MRNFLFSILILFFIGFSLSSCQSVRQNDISVSASNAAPQNSKKEPQQRAEAIQAAPEKEKTKEQENFPADSVQTSAAVGKFENRCGWFSNPTPANASLEDKDGEWIISVQGGYQAEGDYPEFEDDKWVKTNGNYGYGCACMKVKVDYKTHRVLEIASAKVKPLAACRKDPALKEPN
ncbi:MAG TPA: DUF4087 domain-containing protein [Pyrinomonadaceae bacterium]|jgi:hypothetical protein